VTARVLLSGNEAVARGAWESGVRVASAYPGTPSTEILESLATYDDVVAALRAGFEAALDIRFEDGALSAEEERRAWELLPDYAVLTAGTRAAPAPFNS